MDLTWPTPATEDPEFSAPSLSSLWQAPMAHRLLDQIVLGCGRYSLQCRMLNSKLGFSLSDANRTATIPSWDNSKCLYTLPDIPEEQNHPRWITSALKISKDWEYCILARVDKATTTSRCPNPRLTEVSFCCHSALWAGVSGDAPAPCDHLEPRLTRLCHR